MDETTLKRMEVSGAVILAGEGRPARTPPICLGAVCGRKVGSGSREKRDTSKSRLRSSNTDPTAFTPTVVPQDSGPREHLGPQGSMTNMGHWPIMPTGTSPISRDAPEG